MTFDPERDLSIARFIRAPRATVWSAWTEPRQFEQWWVPAPAICRAVRFEPVPGGAMLTEISEDGKPFAPHMNACFLVVEPHGLARLWSIAKEKLRLWPFPH